ncbi:MAG: CRISPR-associated helicase Cas3' [Anaerovoracaceae bacterium]
MTVTDRQGLPRQDERRDESAEQNEDAVKKAAYALWAKKNERDGVYYWLPLYVHLQDTMNVAGWLWDHWLCTANKNYISNCIDNADKDTARRLLGFLCAVHDIGKATPAFQIEKGCSGTEQIDARLMERLEEAGFSGISHLTLVYPKASPHALAGEYILRIFGVGDDIGSIIGAHHGKPIDESYQCSEQKGFPANYYQDADEDSEIHGKWKSVQLEILDQALERNGFSSASELPCISETGQILMSGLVIMSDWIASNENYFSLLDIDESTVDDKQRLARGMDKWAWNSSFKTDNIYSCEELYNNRFGFDPRETQRAVYETIEHIEQPGMIIIEAPMGCGKTETALAAAEQIARKTGRNGLFFGLPTQATSNSMFERVVGWLKTLKSEGIINASVRLAHGNAALNKTMQELAEQVDIDEGNEGSVSVNEWFSGRKKTALDDFVVGTVDNFLLAALKQKHLALRHLGFSQKIVIIDEVHAYDAYMQQYLERALQWMGSYDVPVILLSATLPSEKRKSLIKSYLRGKNMANRDFSSYIDKLDSHAYPLVSFTDGKKIDVFTDFHREEHKIVKIKYISDDEVLDKTEECMNHGGIAGIFVNTVKRAQMLARECADRFGNDKVRLLHSAFISTDRLEKEDDLMKMIGKNGNRPAGGMAIIGTQVIEQSLDIDFDVMISDLCPVDLLIQRIGRLQRNREVTRPDAFRVPTAYISGTSEKLEFNKGSSFVYGDYYLTRTQYFLGDKIDIPSDIPVLVQQVYSDSELELPDELKSKYEQSAEEHSSFQKRERDKAGQFRLRQPRLRIRPDNNMIGWLKDSDLDVNEERASAQVRDIQETVEVIAVRKTGDGYGIFGSADDISGDLDDPETTRKLAQQTLRLSLSIVRRSGITDIFQWLKEYNSENLPEWNGKPWLRGSFGMIFDENGEFDLGNCTLRYDKIYGLRIIERSGDGTI